MFTQPTIPSMVPVVCDRPRTHQRRAQDDDRNGVPVLAMDSCFSTVASIPVLCLKCSRTRVVAAHAMTTKEAMPELVRQIAKDIVNMGHTKVVVKGDNEPAMKLTSRVRDARMLLATAAESPECESQSNGLAQRCVQMFKGLFTTTRIALEHCMGTPVPNLHPVLTCS